MHIAIMRMTFAVALVLAVTATGLWATGGTEEAPAAAADKRYVTDPVTGQVFTAHEWGGTLTFVKGNDGGWLDAYKENAAQAWRRAEVDSGSCRNASSRATLANHCSVTFR